MMNTGFVSLHPLPIINSSNLGDGMGCNAWNHPVDCNCGWGGDTGGGGGRTPSEVRYLPVADGRSWSFDRKPAYHSFVNPNALCPICGAPVYFYQSSFGGRVFFDELGPPWPKHLCTDRKVSTSARQSENSYVLAATKAPVFDAPPILSRLVWRPLLPAEIENLGEYDRIKMSAHDRLAGGALYVPTGWVGQAPAYWRWCPEDATLVEISCISVGEGDSFESRVFRVPNWLNGEDEFDRWRTDPGGTLTSEALNAIGFALSFAWRFRDTPGWHTNIACVDFSLAKDFFERAAETEYWAAINNLGVIYRDGLGTERDPRKAFELFKRAAQSLEVTPLRHLIACYREGFGCEPDPELASYLSELIDIRESEENETD